MPTAAASIPIIDLSLEPHRVGAALIDAYERIGFAQVIGHGVPDDVVTAAFEASRRFHALPATAKAAIALDRNHRGWIADGTAVDRSSEIVAATRPNRSESFMMMREDALDSDEVRRGTPMAGPNQWPDLGGFREPVTACHDAMRDMALAVIARIDEAIGAEGRIIDTYQVPTTWFRLLHYPPVEAGSPIDQFGSAPHTDFGGITFVAQDGTGGLQVAQPDGTWIDVEPIAGAFVMNAGSMLHRWSNGRLKATPHRVDNRSGRERYSCVLFCDPHMNAIVEPVPSCVAAGSAPTFEPVRFADVVAHHLGAIYTQHGAESTAR